MRTGIDALVVVVLVGAVERDGSIQTAFVPFAFPADFVVAPHNRRQQVVVVVAVHRLFEDGCVGGVNALLRCDVVSDAGIGDEAVAFECVICPFRAVFEGDCTASSRRLSARGAGAVSGAAGLAAGVLSPRCSPTI